jgi:hypothetical protein
MEEVVEMVQIRVEMEEQLLHSMEVRTVVGEEEEDKSLQVPAAVRGRVQEDGMCLEDRLLQIQVLAVVEVHQGGLEGLELLSFPIHWVENLLSLHLPRFM